MGFPITPILYLILNGWILHYSFQRAFSESLIGCVIFLIGVALYFISTKLGENEENTLLVGWCDGY